MQISTIKIRTLVKILGKKFFWISLKKNFVPRMLSHRVNVRTSKFWRKSKETKRNFFENLPRAYKDLIKEKKKFQNISCLCTFNTRITTVLGCLTKVLCSVACFHHQKIVPVVAMAFRDVFYGLRQRINISSFVLG